MKLLINVHTVTVAEPKSFKHGHVFIDCWNLKDQPTPFITLSFLKSVTESTFSMLETKYSSEMINILECDFYIQWRLLVQGQP